MKYKVVLLLVTIAASFIPLASSCVRLIDYSNGYSTLYELPMNDEVFPEGQGSSASNEEKANSLTTLEQAATDANSYCQEICAPYLDGAESSKKGHCFEDENAADSYSITMISFSDRDIEILYPQIQNFHCMKVADSINYDLRQMAFQEYHEYRTSKLLEDLSLLVDGEVTFSGSEILCVRYAKIRYLKGSAYIVDSAYASMFDLQNGERLLLEDFVVRENGFIGVLKDNAQVIAVGGEPVEGILAEEYLRPLFEDLVERRDYSDEEILEMLFGDESPDSNGASPYFSDGRLCLVLAPRLVRTSIEVSIDFTVVPSDMIKRVPK